MEHTDDTCATSFLQHRSSVIFGITRVHNNGLIEITREGKLLGKSTTLFESRRIVVMVIEATFADGDRAFAQENFHFGNGRGWIEPRRIVGMNSDRMRDEAGVTARECCSIARCSENIGRAAAGTDADYCAGPRDAGPLDYLVAVAGERRVGEVRVAVDEVWNAAILRGHLRSIHSNTGLAT